MKITDALRYAEDGFELKIDTTPPDQPPSPASRPTKPGGYGLKTRTYQEPVPPPTSSAPVPSLAKVAGPGWELVEDAPKGRMGSLDKPFSLQVPKTAARQLDQVVGHLAEAHHDQVSSELGISSDAARFLIGVALKSSNRFRTKVFNSPDGLGNYRYTFRFGKKKSTVSGTHST